MTDFAYRVAIRATGPNRAEILVLCPGQDFDFRLGDGDMSTVEAQAVGAVLELLTVDQVNLSPFAGTLGPKATARAWSLAVIQHLQTSEALRGIAAAAAAAGADVNTEALKPLVGAL